jgi:hypothetical protein
VFDLSAHQDFNFGQEYVSIGLAFSGSADHAEESPCFSDPEGDLIVDDEAAHSWAKLLQSRKAQPEHVVRRNVSRWFGLLEFLKI